MRLDLRPRTRSYRRSVDSEIDLLKLPEAVSRHLAAGGTLLLPSRQRAAALRRAVVWSHLDSADIWPTPDVLPVRAWYARLAIRHRLPRSLSFAEEWLAWREHVRRNVAGDGLLSVDSLTDGLQRAAGLAADWCLTEQTILRYSSAEAQWLATGMAQVRRVAAERGAIASFDLAAQLRASIGAGLDQRPKYAGFAPTPAFAALGFDAGDLLWVDDSRATATASPVRVHAASDADDEHASIATWARAHLERDPAARLLVVLPDADARRDALDRVLIETLTPSAFAGRRAAPVHEFEGGRALADAPEVRIALELLQALVRPVEPQQLSRVLEEFAWPASRVQRAAVAEQLRAGNPEPVPPTAVAALWRTSAGKVGASGPIEVCIQQFETARLALRDAQPVTVRVARALDALGWDRVGGSDSAAVQTRVAFGALLAALPSVADTAPAAVVELLTALARRENFAPSIGDVAVTISGACEHPIVRYDGIWFGGLQSDRWPVPVRFDPYIPWELQRAAGMPPTSARLRLESARNYLDALSASTADFVCSWARNDGEAELSPSVLLRGRADLVVEPSPSLASRLRDAATFDRERLDDVRGAVWDTTVDVPGGAATLSDQAECPFRAYARTRWLRRPREAWEPGVSPIERGRWLHRVLEKFWVAIGDSQRLAACSEAELDAELDLALREIPVEADLVTEPLDGRAEARERDRLRRVIKLALDLEKQRAPFKVHETEIDRVLEIESLKFNVRPDRIDRLSDGRLVVMDYKSSAYKALDFLGERPRAVQLFCYALALESDGETVAGFGNLHFQLRGAKSAVAAETKEFLPGAGRVDAWSAIRASYAARLTAIAAEFANGDARIRPSKKACEYCDLTPLCRRNEVGGIGSEGEDEADEAEDRES